MALGTVPFPAIAKALLWCGGWAVFVHLAYELGRLRRQFIPLQGLLFGCVVAMLGVLALWVPIASLFAPDTAVMYLNVSLHVEAAPTQNPLKVIYVPGNPAVLSNILEKLVLPERVAIAPERVVLVLDITNPPGASGGGPAWRDFRLPIKIHYEMRSYMPDNGNWNTLRTVDQTLTLVNCKPPLWCNNPIEPGGSLSLIFVNVSPAYAAFEFPTQASVTRIGTIQPIVANINLGGDMLIPLNAQVLPPNPPPNYYPTVKRHAR